MDPDMRVWWIKHRGRDHDFLNFCKALLYLGIGAKDAGKSALLELLAYEYALRGAKIIDLFGSRDCEGLAWCRGPFDKILFVVGDAVDVSSSWNTVRISDLKLNDIQRHDVTLSVSAFHPSIGTEFYGMHKVTETLYRRYSFKNVWFLLVREASNFVYSRLKLAPNQTLAKADFLYLSREARHMGYAMGVDTIRWTSVDADIRGVADYFFVKALGIEGLKGTSLNWLYKMIAPNPLMNLHPRIFVVVSRRGPVGLADFVMPQWHKMEGENMIDSFDIKIEWGEVPDYGDEARHTVSDFEHDKIIATYLVRGSMKKVAKDLARSPATVNTHIKDHDDNIAKLGFCPKCKRVRGQFQRRPISKDRRKDFIQDVPSWEEFEKTFND